MSKAQEPQPKFETALQELEAIVARMESGEMPLEELLQAYQHGSKLLQFCQKSLADIEQQVRILDASNQLQPHQDE